MDDVSKIRLCALAHRAFRNDKILSFQEASAVNPAGKLPVLFDYEAQRQRDRLGQKYYLSICSKLVSKCRKKIAVVNADGLRQSVAFPQWAEQTLRLNFIA